MKFKILTSAQLEQYTDVVKESPLTKLDNINKKKQLLIIFNFTSPFRQFIPQKLKVKK